MTYGLINDDGSVARFTDDPNAGGVSSGTLTDWQMIHKQFLSWNGAWVIDPNMPAEPDSPATKAQKINTYLTNGGTFTADQASKLIVVLRQLIIQLQS